MKRTLEVTHAKTQRRQVFIFPSLVLLGAAVCLAGCTLPVPKTHIAWEPGTRALDIQSPKDVSIGKVEVLAEGTNFTLTITDYKSANPVEVVRAAASAQAAQMAAGQAAVDAVIRAATGAK